ncbi:major facilitator superfamily domain-containing protein [Xylariales sp. PMI_506]|nr:major facilitator superfamily domain-containing protein [Xylariales sp. PMI_506]
MSQEDVDVESGLTLHPTQREQPSGLSQFSELVHSLSNQDAESRYREEAADNRLPVPGLPGCGDITGKTLVSWEENDKENPYNWSTARKWAIVVTTMILIVNSTMGSSLPSMAIPYITAEWGITSTEEHVLPISTYLIGYVMGPIIWGPLSEHFGRKNLTMMTCALFIAWTVGCALAPNWSALLVFRFLAGAVASSPIAIVAGFLADIYDDPVTRGRAFAWFMAMTVFGPLLAPIISGFCSTSIGWRWTFWVALIYAGFSVIPLIWLPETYAPVLLTRRAIKIRKQDPSAKVYSAAELEQRDMTQLMTRVLTRPIRMLISELIVTSTCLYLSLLYAIFYMSFQAFPLIFQDLYGLSPGVTGLCFLPIGIGCLLSLPIFYAYDAFLRRAQAQNKPWSKQEEYRRVPLAFIGGPMFAMSLFWLGWSAREGVSFVAPMLAGIPFGMGFMLIFMALLNYLTDAYDVFAASANAIASTTRSLFAVVLPFATTPMFSRLGIAGSCSLLGGLSAMMCVIPYIFIWKGEQIRARSKFCIALKQQKLELNKKAEEERQRRRDLETQRCASQQDKDAEPTEENLEMREKEEKI